ncbi:hypothetical protein ABK040_005014 [Willaertia magna]
MNSLITDLLGTQFIRLSSDGSKLENFKENPLPFLKEKKILLYFSAHWCPPCRMFTPTLIEMVNTLKEEGHGNKFVVVFISCDEDEEAMIDYMKSTRMPWLALPYNSVQRGLCAKYDVTAIPSVILLNSNLERDELCPLRGHIETIKKCVLQ